MLLFASRNGSGFSCRWYESALGEFLVESQQAIAIVADALEFFHDQAETGLFLDLLGDEPLQEDLRCVVVVLARQVNQLVDAGGDELLVFKRVLEAAQR